MDSESYEFSLEIVLLRDTIPTKTIFRIVDRKYFLLISISMIKVN